VSVWVRWQHAINDMSTTRQVEICHAATAHLTGDQRYAVPVRCARRPRYLIISGIAEALNNQVVRVRLSICLSPFFTFISPE